MRVQLRYKYWTGDAGQSQPQLLSHQFGPAEYQSVSAATGDPEVDRRRENDMGNIDHHALHRGQRELSPQAAFWKTAGKQQDSCRLQSDPAGVDRHDR